VRYNEAMARYVSATEEVAMKTVTNYFNLLMADVNLSIARQNFDNAVTLYEVAEAKYEMGQISRNDLLQLELNRLSAESSLTSAQTDMQAAMFALRSFLGIDQNVEVVPELPEDIPPMELSYQDVLTKALERNSFAKSLRRRQLEADYEVAVAKGNRRQINLFAQVGYTGTNSRIGDAYSPLRDNQVVEIGFNIPILDWGKREGKVKVAQSNRDVVESRLRKERLDFEQDIFILVERFNHQCRQLQLAERADTIAARRYDTNVETFLVGRISTLDLNDSRVSKDENRRSVIDRLYLSWYYYYQLRSLTLWDFMADSPIEIKLERLK
ncbi:MAG: TolC family protein, partial [Duncaniella sp.]|nr:TolC family protein [Duncaniella sp.]